MKQTPLLTIALVLGLVSGCGSSKKTVPAGFCKAVVAYENALPKASASQQQKLMQKMRDTSPPEVRANADLLLDGYNKVLHGQKISNEDTYRKASEQLERFANDRCNLLQDNSGSAGI